MAELIQSLNSLTLPGAIVMVALIIAACYVFKLFL